MSSSPPSRSPPRTSSLPLDLLRNVLSRLTTISLLKLRPVCREWCDVVDDPHFTATHASSDVEGPRVLLLLEPSGSGNANPPFTLSNQLLVTWPPELAPISWLFGAGAGASCQGLLCFEDPLDGVTYLLNPLTQETVSVSVGSSATLCEQPPCLRRIAIGLDHVTGRYKIWAAEVLDQGSRSWRDIGNVPVCLLHLLGDPVFAAGSIHWEEFTLTPCPEFREACLGDLRGALGLFDRSIRNSVDVWRMEEETGASPWPVNGSRWFQEFLCRCGWKMELMFKRRVLIYDPAAGELEHVQRGGARVMAGITVSLLSPAKLWNEDKVVVPVVEVATINLISRNLSWVF
ncbi:hypothetical protein BT93_E1074 [Corymbia citriodora subsp. variegata]|nr:hypothetical protein BT93_E1074 [Corymbia citriodora subsp. variegata]